MLNKKRLIIAGVLVVATITIVIADARFATAREFLPVPPFTVTVPLVKRRIQCTCLRPSENGINRTTYTIEITLRQAAGY